MKAWKRFRNWQFKRKANKAIRVLDALDWWMKDQGWTRHERRNFWKQYRKSDKTRNDVLNQITLK